MSYADQLRAAGIDVDALLAEVEAMQECFDKNQQGQIGPLVENARRILLAGTAKETSK